MQTRTHLAALMLAASLAYAPHAHAHICMDAPVSRVGPSCSAGSAQKPGPCGINTRSTQYVTTFRPGETITVQINETINHGSHYRIAFNPNGDEFEDPTSKDDNTGKHPFVLLDNITDEAAAKQSVKVTLPNMTCDNCTLQLIQVMYDKGGNGFGNDDIYYSCADIVLKGAPVTNADAGTSDAGSSDIIAPQPDGGAARPAVDAGGGTTGSGGTAGGALGGSSDASIPSTSDSGAAGPVPGADAGSPTSGTAGGATGGGGAPEEEDEGDGCSVGWSQTRSATPWTALVIGLGGLVARRRRNRA